ncbi:MAG: hypothetical protein RLZ57_1080 [Actinomycetota bacterium]|jgi:probable phosphoglycerate mutase
MYLGSKLMARNFVIFADGGSRGNPGPAGYGSVVIEENKVVTELSEFIGTATNNVAEYRGLIAGLQYVNSIDPDATVEVNMDSKLVVEQMSGRWQIKHEGMREMAKAARAAHNPSLVTYKWVPREENSHADSLANRALDERVDGKKTSKPINLLTDRLRSEEIPTTIYLIRHGETEFTAIRRFSGSRLNPKLIDKGIEQAQAVAKYVKKLNPDVLIASPLIRTQETAEIISKEIGIPFETDESWKECDFGKWDGLTPEEVRNLYGDNYETWIRSTSVPPIDGESYDDVAVRADLALATLVDKYPSKKVVVVTHNIMIRQCARLAIDGNPTSPSHVDILPGSVTSITIWPSDGLRALRTLSERAFF